VTSTNNNMMKNRQNGNITYTTNSSYAIYNNIQ